MRLKLLPFFFLLPFYSINGIVMSQELPDFSKKSPKSKTIYVPEHYQTVRGKILDELTQTPLPGATVILLNSNPLKGTTADGNGDFRIEQVPTGRQGIKVTYLGYKEKILENLIVGSAKEVILNINMIENPVQVEEVEIKSKVDRTLVNNEVVTVSGRGFNMDETNRYAGTRDDPSRMVANYAGVGVGNDIRNDIIVRGNSPVGVLWKLDGIDIPNPNHFSIQGATGGPISILNNNLLDKSDFLTSAFPAEYGNKMAAVFDLKMRKGNDEQNEFTGQFGFNGIELMAEGPISKKNKSSYLASYRYSTLQIFNLLGIDFGAPGLPQYQDFSTKLNFPTEKFGIFSVVGIGGKSTISIYDSTRNKADLITDLDRGFDIATGSDMGVLGVSNQHLFTKNSFGKITFAISGAKFSNVIDTVWYDTTLKRNLREKDLWHNFSSENKIDAIYTFHHKINLRHFIKTGVNYTRFIFKLDERNKRMIFYDQTGNTEMVQSFFHWQWKISLPLTLNAGVNYKYFFLNEKKALEPRFGLKYEISQRQSLNAGFGVHTQSQILSTYFLEKLDTNAIPPRTLLTNKNMDFTSAYHYVLGYNLSLSDLWKFKTEFYYQDLSKIPVESTKSSFSMINAGADYNGPPKIDSLLNNGTAFNYGTEFTFEKIFSNDFYFLSTFSFYTSKYKGSDGIERSTQFDGGYVINLLGGTEFKVGKKGKVLVFDTKYTMAGGRRYTPVNVDSSIKYMQAYYNTEQAYSKKFSPYSRLDMKLGFRNNYQKFTLTWFVSVENVLNQENVLQQVFNKYNLDNGKDPIEEVYQLKLFYIGGFKIEF